MKSKLLELRFPLAGVDRRAGYANAGAKQDAYATPWAVNVRPEDGFARRLRGGSRPGLTKLIAEQAGTTIADMKAIQVGSTEGPSELLAVLVDDLFGVIADGTLTMSDDEAPTAAFLVAGQQHVYAIADDAITKLDPKAGTATKLTASAGTMPTGATLGVIYRDRLFLAGADNAIYPSALGDYTNWDTSVDASRSTRALPALQLSEAADVGAVPTALVAFRDASLLLATANSLWVVRGDPGAAGGLTAVSRHVGILGARAWCKVENEIVLLAGDGIYFCGPEGGNLTNLSGERLPVDLRDVDPETTSVLMGYDHAWSGIHVYLGAGPHWFFHLPTKTFWPMALQADHAPMAVCEYGGQLLLGCADGYIRAVGGEDDDGEDIESHVLFGPIPLAGEPMFGVLGSLHGILAAGSGVVAWRIVTGDTAEAAASRGKAAIEAFQAGGNYSTYVDASGVWGEGRSLVSRPRVRGMWACLWLQSFDKWGFEQAMVETLPAGRWR